VKCPLPFSIERGSVEFRWVRNRCSFGGRPSMLDHHFGLNEDQVGSVALLFPMADDRKKLTARAARSVDVSVGGPWARNLSLWAAKAGH
jgi:hypothetical protein